MLPLTQPFADLPDSLHRPAAPSPVPDPRLLHLNEPLARELGLDPAQLRTPELTKLFAGNAVPTGVAPIATAYAGHQFGGFSPVLGDGRAILLGQLSDTHGGPQEIQLKGAGQTPFSRPGSDGRNWVGPVLREYLLSEAMHQLGIPTTRALAALATGRPVMRERPWPGAVIVRVAPSHLRVGTFEYLAYRGENDAMATLVDHVLSVHYPDTDPGEHPAATLLTVVAQRQAALVAKWLGVGFIHGVMNTDNCSVLGLTIDYGPCAFLDVYHPDKKFSSIDHMGRYRYANQPRIAHWNLGALASALLPLLPSVDHARGILDQYPDAFAAEHLSVFRPKLGLQTEQPEDGALIADLMTLMADQEADFTNAFRALAHLGPEPSDADAPFRSQFSQPTAVDPWLARWRTRIATEPEAQLAQPTMQAANPALIPRNHRVEQMIQAAILGDLAPLERLVDALSRPFELRPGFEDLAEGPKPDERVFQTFCGT